MLLRKRIDGVILKGALQGDLVGRANPELLKRLEELPVVWVMGRPAGCRGDVVQANDIAEIDASLLTDDLPINAYLDNNFEAWLKRSLQQ